MAEQLDPHTTKRYRITRRHLLVVGVLCCAFSISFLLRAQPAEYGFELHEFDPFFNYRATEFLLENGIYEYFDWHDDLSWHPSGRDVSATSQVMLHLTAAATYHAFGGNSSLYDFAIIMPAVFGSLTAIVIFALVRVIAGSTAGLFASMLFSVSLPIALRGTLGWFKSEPLGIFYGLLAVYLFLSGIRSADKKTAAAKMLGGGVILGFGLASWGGIQFFVLPLGVFLLALPFLRNDSKLVWSIPAFVSALLLTAASFERPGTAFVFGLGGLALAVPTVFFVACRIIQSVSKEQNSTRNCLVLLLAVVLSGSALIIINQDAEFLQLPSFRYLNAINPFLTATNTLTDSVSEHTTTSIRESFFFHSILMIFAALGAWLLLGKSGRASQVPPDMAAFALIAGLAGVYVSSAFVRLEVFASIAVIVLSSVGLSILVRQALHNKSLQNPRNALRNRATKNAMFIGVVLLLLVPFLMPAGANWMTFTSVPPTILNGGTQYQVGTSDWPESLEWIKHHTPEGSVVAAWWDYGYWISTVSQRTTLADNATIDSGQIEKIAKAFLSAPADGWRALQDMGADYVVVFVAGERLAVPSEEPLYVLKGGGDESKKQWIMRIAGVQLSKYLHPDGDTPTDYFWNETLLGRLFPFSTLGYVHFESNLQVREYVPGTSAVYVKEIKYPQQDGDAPFRLVYASPSYENEEPGPMLGVFVYEINGKYDPG